MTDRGKIKENFKKELQGFANSLGAKISLNDEWTIKGFIDTFEQIYTISSDTKIVSKILEIHLFPHFLEFAENIGYDIELPTHQNWYPDITFISKKDSSVMFAVDLKTSYRNETSPDMCNGFTLGSHGEYFKNRDSTKNIQYPYNQYTGHFCLGIIYSRKALNKEEELKKYDIEQLSDIPSVISNFLFFAEEKWKIASDKSGSGNTANIGSIKCIADLVAGNGVFAIAGEHAFDDYWINYGVQKIADGKGGWKSMTSFAEYLESRNLSPDLNNCHPKRKKG